MGKMLISLLFLFWLLDRILIKVVTNPLSKKCVEFCLNQVALLELSFLISFESELLSTQEKKVVYWLESWLIAITLQWFLHFKMYFKEGSCLRRVWWVLSFCICSRTFKFVSILDKNVWNELSALFSCYPKEKSYPEENVLLHVLCRMLFISQSAHDIGAGPILHKPWMGELLVVTLSLFTIYPRAHFPKTWTCYNNTRW